TEADRRQLKNQPSKPNNSARHPNFAIGSSAFPFWTAPNGSLRPTARCRQCSPTATRSMSPLDITVEGEREVNKRLFGQLQRGEREYYEMVQQFLRKDGQSIWVQLYMFAIRDQGSGALHTFGLMLDITERTRAQSALQDARAEIARVARISRMGAMTASIAHEIAQPLTAMVSNANAGLRWLTQAPPDFEEVRAVLENIVRAGHRASEIIQGIRALF